jgi:RNA recognition motif-containing protein
MNMTDLYIGSIPFKWTEKQLEEIFSPYGNIVSCKIIIDKRTRQNKGFGFVTFSEVAEAQKAILALDQTEHLGRKISVLYSMPKKEEKSVGRNPPSQKDETPARKSFFTLRKKY